MLFIDSYFIFKFIIFERRFQISVVVACLYLFRIIRLTNPKNEADEMCDKLDFHTTVGSK